MSFRYRSAEHDYEMTPSSTPVTSEVWRDEDGEIRTREADYPFVQNADQAARLAAYDVADSREGIRMSLPCKARLLGYPIGGAITVDLGEAGDAQKMLIVGRGPDPLSGKVTLSLRSETDAKHPFALGRTGTPPPLPALTLSDETVLAAPAAENWSAVGTTLSDNDASVPAIIIEGEPDAPEAAWLLTRFRPVGAAAWANAADRGVVLNLPMKVELSAGLTPGTAYEVEIAYRSRKGVPGEWLALGPVTAGALSVAPSQAARLPISRSIPFPTGPGVPPETAIAVLAHTAWFADGSSEQLPAGGVGQLAGLTRYGVFWRAADGYQAEAAPAPSRMSNGRWVFVGWHTTTDALGAYPAPIARPPGSGGAGAYPDQNQADTPSTD